MNGRWRYGLLKSGAVQIIQPIAVSRPISNCCSSQTDVTVLFCICSALLIINLVVCMASVDSIISLLAADLLSYEKKLELKQTGRDQPVFSFAGKRQCRLLDQYSKHTWLTACPIRKSLFCFPCLIFKPSTTAWSSQTG